MPSSRRRPVAAPAALVELPADVAPPPGRGICLAEQIALEVLYESIQANMARAEAGDEEAGRKAALGIAKMEAMIEGPGPCKALTP